jgi:acid-sensing ion channel, other
LNNISQSDKDKALTFKLNAPAKVYVHSTEEVSSFDTRALFIYQSSHVMDLLITMKETFTVSDAKQLSITQRKCLFSDEKLLSYYHNDGYSLSACMKQCRMERALQSCKCIPPFYEPATLNGKRCALENLKCLAENSHNITDHRGCKHCRLNCLSTIFEADKYTKLY